MLKHVGIVIGREQGVDRHRNQARVHRAQKAHRPVIAVEHQEQHTLFTFDAQVVQARSYTAHALVELPVAEGSHVVDESHLVGTRRIALQQVLGKVETLARRGHLGRGAGILA